MVEIIKILGTPTRTQIKSMNQNYTEFKFPQIKQNPWNKVFTSKNRPDSKALQHAFSLVGNLLKYEPKSRLKPLEALAHPFFADLRENVNEPLPNGNLPPKHLFEFSEEERNSVSYAK